MASFETVAHEYDTARPSYPDEIFDALGPIDGLQVFDVGAGTGIATRALIARGAHVTAIDPGRQVLRRAKTHTPLLSAIAADGAALPVRASIADLVCFAQSWHWLNPQHRVAEMHRILRPGGMWAGWWSHARADQHQWFDDYWSAIEQTCNGTSRTQRDIDWGSTISSEQFDVSERVVVPWTRTITIESWMTDQASHSYIVGLPETDRQRLLTSLEQIIRSEFPSSSMTVRYETWLWTATRV